MWSKGQNSTFSDHAMLHIQDVLKSNYQVIMYANPGPNNLNPYLHLALRNYTGCAELYAHGFMRTHKYAPDFFCGSLFYLCLSLAYYLVKLSVFCSLVFTWWEKADL